MESNIGGNHEDLIQFWRRERRKRFSVAQEGISSGQVSTAEQIRESFLVYIILSFFICRSGGNFRKVGLWYEGIFVELALELMNSGWQIWVVLVPDHEAKLWL